MASNGYIVGVTGGIGSGKSTVAGLFAALGVGVVDTDAVAHALTAVGGRAMDPIRARMGQQFIAADGALDRVATRDRVFADAIVKLQLESILHPLIREEVESALQADTVRDAPYAMLMVPLLFETQSYRDRVDETLLIDCPIATQLERVARRSGLNSVATSRIVDAQLPRALRLQLSDDVIWNGDSAEALRPQIEPLHAHYMEKARKRS